MTTTDSTDTGTVGVQYSGRLTILPDRGPIGEEFIPVPTPPDDTLTPTDRRILLARLDGQSVDAIAASLSLSSEVVAKRVKWLRDHFAAWAG